MVEAFTLKEHNLTREYHIFRGRFTLEGCNSEYKSICGTMTNEQSLQNIVACKREQEARELCAKYGRKVCANCIEYLYKTI